MALRAVSGLTVAIQHQDRRRRRSDTVLECHLLLDMYFFTRLAALLFMKPTTAHRRRITYQEGGVISQVS